MLETVMSQRCSLTCKFLQKRNLLKLRKQDVVITVLSSSSHVLDVYNGPNDLLQGKFLRLRSLTDSSTIDPQTSRKLAAVVSNCVLKEKKDSWENALTLDAPVSGGVVAAEVGTLTFMIDSSSRLSSCKAVTPFNGKKHSLLW